ncbi:MAG: alanine:cation symporter family protein [Gammaproteobacteria bacterium]|nr:alanine:cation symporter family protein [Gammaproteobacteria bacterium]MCP4929790.1 alanine:cation symporter family protein [Gammaproteobacteria bacterium]
MDAALTTINSILWHDYVLYAMVITGITFTFWSGFSQYRALTHGTKVIRGIYDDPNDPGAINHFQALSTALSATVGLGNIGGVAIAISLGGPGAVFWMWVIGFLGMATKLTEVTLTMLYRNTDNPDNPHGGPMWVASKGLTKKLPWLGFGGKIIGGLFCITTLIMTATGGNMFQAWNTGAITQAYFGVPSVASGIVLAMIVGAVIIGGIKRIGAVTGRLVPIMVVLYLLAALYALAINFAEIPAIFALIFQGAFSTLDASGAFIGGTMGYAFLFGMKRAIFSNEAGQGTSPIAHSAAKTSEPVREGVVAGLEPFLDTIVVCTLTALVILSTGVWQRGAEAVLVNEPQIIETEAGWTLANSRVSKRHLAEWETGERVFIIVHSDLNPRSDNNIHRLDGTIFPGIDGDFFIEWETLTTKTRPEIFDHGVYLSYVGATLTAKAFDTLVPGLGKWLVTLTVWFFAISTMISYSYYGEQAMVFLAGEKSVMAYKLVFCILAVVATAGFLQTDTQLDNLTGLGTGVMLFVNVPIMWVLGAQAMRAYKDYIKRLDNGQMTAGHKPPSLEDLISGKDVE